MTQFDSPPPRLKAGPETPAQLRHALRALGKQDAHAARLSRVAGRLGDLLDAPPPTPFAGGAMLRHASSKVLVARLVIAALAVGTTTAVWLSRSQTTVHAPSAQESQPSTGEAPLAQPLPDANSAPRNAGLDSAALPVFAASPGRAAALGTGGDGTRALAAPTRRHGRGGRRLSHVGRASSRSSSSVGTAATGTAAPARQTDIARAGVAPTSAEPTAASVAAGPVATGPVVAGPVASGPSAAASEPRAEHPLTEVELLFEARRSIGRDPRAALDLLDEHAARFSDGLLAPEREVLAIEALRKLRQSRAAAQRLRGFRARYPDSNPSQAPRPRATVASGVTAQPLGCRERVRLFSRPRGKSRPLGVPARGCSEGGQRSAVHLATRSTVRSDLRSAAPSAYRGWRVGAGVSLVVGCTSAHDSGSTPGGDAHDASAGQDAQAQAVADAAGGAAQCTLNQDCSLISTGCCESCLPDLKTVRAVPSARAAAERNAVCSGPVSCSPCPPLGEHDLAAQLRAACIQGLCVGVDTRTEASTVCASDSECTAVALGCCGVCEGTPKDYFAFRAGAEDPHEPECTPVPPCSPCADQTPPAVYCAADGHCAVRLVPLSDAGTRADGGV